MGQEVDAWPADEVEALSPAEWQAFLRRWFRKRGWGDVAAPKLADGLANLYKNESDRDPQVCICVRARASMHVRLRRLITS
jgi:hypothetical protein